MGDGSKPSIFQPDHTGKHKTVRVHPGMVSHTSHTDARAIEHANMRGSNIAQAGGKPKNQNPVHVHGGMETRSKTGHALLGGHAKSAMDALTGSVVVPGTIKSTPGRGNQDAQTGHPLAKAPGSKNLKPVPVSFGMRSRSGTDHEMMHQLGEAMLQEAYRAADPNTRQAHGRGRDGAKLPPEVDES